MQEWSKLLHEANPEVRPRHTSRSVGPCRFGPALRCFRLGYRWSDKYEALIRIAIIGENRIQIIMCPPNQIPNTGRKNKYYVCWWDEPDGLDLSKAIQNNAKPSKPVVMVVDDSGELISKEFPAKNLTNS